MRKNNTVSQTHNMVMCTAKELFLTNDSHELHSFISELLRKANCTSNGYKVLESSLYRYVLPVICCFGILGNMLNLVILSSKSLTVRMERLEKCAHLPLIALAVSDLMYCAAVLPHSFMHEPFVQDSYISPWLLYDAYHGAVINTFLLCSSWLTVAMAVSRYIAICYPVKARQHLGITTTRMGIISIFVISVTFNVPRYFQKAIYKVQCQEGGYSYFAFHGLLRKHCHAEHIYLWIYFVIGILFPLTAVVFCNIYFIKALRASRKLHRSTCRYSPSATSHSNNPNVLTLTFSIIVGLYILLVTPAEVIQFYKDYIFEYFSENQNVVDDYSLTIAVFNILQTLNFTVNFVLYSMINVHFRRVIESLVCHFRYPEHNPRCDKQIEEKHNMLSKNAVTVDL